jgi:hypothetical protein
VSPQCRERIVRPLDATERVAEDMIMDRHDNERPSIFNRPFDEDDAAEATRAHPSPSVRVRPTPRRPIDAVPPDAAGVRPAAHGGGRGVGREHFLLAAMGLAILALGGFIAASMIRGDPSAVAAGDPSAASSGAAPQTLPSASSTDAPASTATPRPTPEPTPAGPPVELAVGGWATVTVGELNVRGGAGRDHDSRYRLVEDAVVHIAEGPVSADGGNWYRVASLGGAAGWVSSGWGQDPFLDILVDDPTLIRCGTVTRPVFEIVDGSPRPADPLHIGRLALPVAAFSDLSLGVIELMRGMEQEACFSAVVGASGLPVIRTELNVGACGHAAADGNFYRLRPAAGGASLASQVKEPVVLHPSLLVGGPPDDRKSSNLRAIVTMMANEGVTGCINASAVGGRDAVIGYRSVDVSQCSVVHEYNEHSLKLTPAAGGEVAWIKLSAEGYEPGRFPLETPVSVGVNAQASDDGRSAYAWIAGEPGCG